MCRRVEQKCAEVFHRNTSFHFDTVRPRPAAGRRRQAGPRTLPRWPGAARQAARATESNQQKNKHAHDLPPLSPLHTYSCTRSTHVAAHGRESTWHDQKEVTRATQACRGTCNHQCLEHFGTLRNTSGTLRYGRVGPRWLSCSEVIRTHIEPAHRSEHFCSTGASEQLRFTSEHFRRHPRPWVLFSSVLSTDALTCHVPLTLGSGLCLLQAFFEPRGAISPIRTSCV